jgi:hypothetical protein
MAWQLHMVIGYHVRDGFYMKYSHNDTIASFDISAEAHNMKTTGELFVVEVAATQADRKVKLDAGIKAATTIYLDRSSNQRL